MVHNAGRYGQVRVFLESFLVEKPKCLEQFQDTIQRSLNLFTSV